MIEALILGIVQGLTEFLPVSSTAHLILFPWFFNWTGELESLTFDVALHAGTLLALFICFWKDWTELISRKQRLFVLIMIASVPAGIAGFLLHDFVENALRNPYVIAVSLVVFGCVMLLAEKLNTSKTVDDMTFQDAVTIGIAQVVALIPGVSLSFRGTLNSTTNLVLSRMEEGLTASAAVKRPRPSGSPRETPETTSRAGTPRSRAARSRTP